MTKWLPHANTKASLMSWQQLKTVLNNPHGSMQAPYTLPTQISGFPSFQIGAINPKMP